RLVTQRHLMPRRGDAEQRRDVSLSEGRQPQVTRHLTGGYDWPLQRRPICARQPAAALVGHPASGDFLEQPFEVRKRRAHAADLRTGGLMLAQTCPAGYLREVRGKLPE